MDAHSSLSCQTLSRYRVWIVKDKENRDIKYSLRDISEIRKCLNLYGQGFGRFFCAFPYNEINYIQFPPL